MGDGPRDGATVPHLVERLLNIAVRPDCRPWARLNDAGRGYGRKLRYAVRQAKSIKAHGVVLTVDTDKDRRREKLRALREGRDEELASSPPFPTVLGEATPHAEAWLQDDRVAVARALGVKAEDVPNIAKTPSPKDALEALRKQGVLADAHIMDVLRAIARQVDPSRCEHAKHTGFHGFCEEVRRELRPHVDKCDEECRCGEECGGRRTAAASSDAAQAITKKPTAHETDESGNRPDAEAP